MASIPQEQISDAYYHIQYYPNEWYTFGRGYKVFGNKNEVKMYHYGTLIYECNTKTKKFKVGGYSQSDVNAINSMAYHTCVGGAYIQNGTLYAKGTGPKYEKGMKRKGI